MKATPLFPLLLLTLASAQVPKLKPLTPALQRAFAAHLRRERDTEEEEAQRQVIYGDVNGDGVPDAVIRYVRNALRGNGWGESLAVFLYQKGAYKLAADEVVGGKFFRSFQLEGVVNHCITGVTRTCPNLEVVCDRPLLKRVQLVLVGAKLREKLP